MERGWDGALHPARQELRSHWKGYDIGAYLYNMCPCLMAVKGFGSSVGRKLHGESDHLRWALKDRPWRWTWRGTDLTNKFGERAPRQRD